jgi:hypothetical protein
MPQNTFPCINKSYKRYLNGSCPNRDQQCYYDTLLGEETQNYVEVIADVWNTVGRSFFS